MLFIWTLFSSKNAENVSVSTKILGMASLFITHSSYTMVIQSDLLKSKIIIKIITTIKPEKNFLNYLKIDLKWNKKIVNIKYSAVSFGRSTVLIKQMHS